MIRLPNKRGTVFLSYVYVEYDREAQEIEALLKAEGFEVLRSDFTSGLVSDALKRYEEIVRESDILIAIYGYSYGNPIPDVDLFIKRDYSYLEWEYLIAENSKKTVLAFIERIPKRDERLELLIDRVVTRKGMREFSGTSELLDEVRDALSEYLRKTCLKGRYTIERSLARGGYGEVFLALDTETGKEVAVKHLVRNDIKALQLFRQEAEILTRFTHPALPRLIDKFTELGRDYLVMEFVPGEDLQAKLDMGSGLPDVNEVLDWAEQLLSALEYIHGEGLTHLDIKPSNIKVTPNGEIKLLDFGLARAEDKTLPPMSSTIFVTPVYAAPEQFLPKSTSQPRTDARTDLYSLGATLRALLTGDPPVPATERSIARAVGDPDPYVPISERNHSVSPIVSGVIDQALSIRRDSRPQSAAVMLHQLRFARRRAERPTALTHLSSAAETALTEDSLSGYIPTSLPLSRWGEILGEYKGSIAPVAETKREVALARSFGVTTVEQLDRLLEASIAWGGPFLADYFKWLRQANLEPKIRADADGNRHELRGAWLRPNDIIVYVLLASFVEQYQSHDHERLVRAPKLLLEAARRHNPQFKLGIPWGEWLQLNLPEPLDAVPEYPIPEPWPVLERQSLGVVRTALVAVAEYLDEQLAPSRVLNYSSEKALIILEPISGARIGVMTVYNQNYYTWPADAKVRDAERRVAVARSAGADLLYEAAVFSEPSGANKLIEQMEDEVITSPNLRLAVGYLSNENVFTELASYTSEDSRW